MGKESISESTLGNTNLIFSLLLDQTIPLKVRGLNYSLERQV